jgi:glycosyltransferase involved in cell wall biosynthesis
VRLSEPDDGAEPVSVVVPVFNSEATLEELTERIAEVCSRRGADWELILVNDGSSDGSWRMIAAVAERHRNVRGLDLVRNFGQHNATLAGIESAKFAVILTLDDDLQNPPEEMPVLLAALSPEVDIVYGTPSRTHYGHARTLAARAARRLTHLLSRGRIPLEVSSFRAFRAGLRGPAVAGLDGARISLDAQLCRSGDRCAAVEVRHDSRRHGSSNYTPAKLIRHGVTVLTTSVGSGRTPTGDPPYAVRARTPSPGGR